MKKFADWKWPLIIGGVGLVIGLFVPRDVFFTWPWWLLATVSFGVVVGVRRAWREWLVGVVGFSIGLGIRIAQYVSAQPPPSNPVGIIPDAFGDIQLVWIAAAVGFGLGWIASAAMKPKR